MLKTRRIVIVVDQPLDVHNPRPWVAKIKGTNICEAGETKLKALLNLFLLHGRWFGVKAIHWREGFGVDVREARR